MKRLIIVALPLMLLQSHVGATQRETAQSTAVIAGVVVRTGTREPIEGARVTITKVNPAAAGGIDAPFMPVFTTFLEERNAAAHFSPSTPSLPIVTDASGRFAFRGLDAGAYRIAISATGYAPQEYGNVTDGSPAASVTEQHGERSDESRFSDD